MNPKAGLEKQVWHRSSDLPGARLQMPKGKHDIATGGIVTSSQLRVPAFLAKLASPIYCPAKDRLSGTASY